MESSSSQSTSNEHPGHLFRERSSHHMQQSLDFFNEHTEFPSVCDKYRMSHLGYAIYRKQLSWVGNVLESDSGDVNWVDHTGKTAVHKVCHLTDSPLEYLELLIKKGADVNPTGSRSTPLHLVMMNSGCPLSVELLLKHGADVHKRDMDYNLPLHLSASYCTPDVTRQLIDAGADVNARGNGMAEPLRASARYSSLETMKLFVKEYHCDVNDRAQDGTTALYITVEHCRIEHVKFLLENKADANIGHKSGLLPLHIAVQRNHSTLIPLLIEHTDFKRITPHKFYSPQFAFLTPEIDMDMSIPSANQEVFQRIRSGTYQRFITFIKNECVHRNQETTIIHDILFDKRLDHILEYRLETIFCSYLNKCKTDDPLPIVRLLLSKGCLVNTTITDCVQPLISLANNYNLFKNEFESFKRIFFVLISHDVNVDHYSRFNRFGVGLDVPDAILMASFLSKEVLLLFMSYSKCTVYQLLNTWEMVISILLKKHNIQELARNMIVMRFIQVVIPVSMELVGCDYHTKNLTLLIQESSFITDTLKSQWRNLGTPKSLIEICRLKIRMLLSEHSPAELSIADAIDEFRIPGVVKGYLLYKDKY